MTKLLSVFLTLFLTPVTAFSAPPEVPKEVSAKAGQLVRIAAKGAGEIGTLKNFSDEKAFFDELLPRPGERRFVFQSQDEGVYVVGFFTVGEKEGVACTITVGKGKPTDPVDPPVIQTKHVTFVAPDAASAAVVNDADMRTYLRVAGAKVYVVQSATILSPGFREAVERVGTPAVVMQDSAGNVVAAAKITTSNAVKEMFK